MSDTDPTRRMLRLWERMSAVYGSRWQIEYGPCLNGERLAPIAALWAEALTGYDNSIIGSALRKLLDRDALNPPTLPEFLRLCGRRNESIVTAAHQLLPPAPHDRPEPASPADRCARLAEQLDSEARPIINERLSQAAPGDYRTAVSRYWSTRLAAIGSIGQAVTTITRPPAENADHP